MRGESPHLALKPEKRSTKYEINVKTEARMLETKRSVGFDHWIFEHSCLFRIPNFEFRVSDAVWGHERSESTFSTGRARARNLPIGTVTVFHFTESCRDQLT